MKNFIKTILAASLMLAGVSVQGAEAPMPRQEKRKYAETESVVAATAAEAKKTKTQPSALEQLPPELKAIILSFLVTATGNTKEARLQAAAQNIRNFMILNKSFNKYLNDEDINGHIIIELAKRYTDNDIDHAAAALHTRAGTQWLTKISPRLINAISDGDIKVASEILTKFPYLVNTPIHVLGEAYGFDTLLIRAIVNSNINMIKLLLSIPGIDINQRDDLGHTALDSTYTDLAEDNPNKDEIVALLKAHGARNAGDESKED